jgi:two-component system sensor kinase FixL
LIRRFKPSAIPTFWLSEIAHRPAQRPWLDIAIALLAISIFGLDLSTQTYPKGVLYSVLLLIAAGTGLRQWVVKTAILSVTLTVNSYAIARYFIAHIIAQILSISVVTFGFVCFPWATDLLRERVLDQTHDGVSTYALNGMMTFWSKSATELYGWTSQEACDAFSQDLLTRLPLPAGELHELLLKQGFWSGASC